MDKSTPNNGGINQANERDPEQAWYFTKDWQDGESIADEEIRTGKLCQFGNVEDAIQWLHSHN